MPHDHQSAILRAMCEPSFYPHPVTSVTVRRTHISTVFLTGTYVYKVKQAVNPGFLDFTTLRKRETACRREVILNRRLAEDVYLDVLPITAAADGYRLAGSGEKVEVAVRMRQLADADRLCDRLHAAAFTAADMAHLVDRLTAFYEAASVDQRTPPANPPVWAENLDQIRCLDGTVADDLRFKYVRTAMHAFYRRHRRRFERRRREGRIRDGHGDLRSDHIYFTPRGIRIIDCIEFDRSLRVLDVIDDLAFLVMDLVHNGFGAQAKALIQSYLRRSDDLGALFLIDFYACHRAMVRCKVSICQRADPAVSANERNALASSVGDYLALAHDYAARFSRTTLWIVFGLPAAGKSTLAKALADHFDVVLLRSDVIRKQCFGDTADVSGDIDRGIYSPQATEMTYRNLLARAEAYLKQGSDVVLDATFSRLSHRRLAIALAAQRQATAIFIECRASTALLRERLQQRDRRPGISDARLTHLPHFQQRFEPWMPMDEAQHIVVRTDAPVTACLRQVILSQALWPESTNPGGQDV